MSWRQGAQDTHKLESLSSITVRLLRLTIFKKLSRGEAQLRAYGLPANLTEEYKKYAKEQARTIPDMPRKEEAAHVRVHVPEESAF